MVRLQPLLLFLVALVVPGGFIAYLGYFLLRRFRRPSRKKVGSSREPASPVEAQRPVLTHSGMILSQPFRILTDYVEGHPDVFVDRPAVVDPLYESYWETMAEIRALYLWWANYPLMRCAIDNEDPSVREYTLQFLEEEEQTMLTRLVNVRKRLV